MRVQIKKEFESLMNLSLRTVRTLRNTPGKNVDLGAIVSVKDFRTREYRCMFIPTRLEDSVDMMTGANPDTLVEEMEKKIKDYYDNIPDGEILDQQEEEEESEENKENPENLLKSSKSPDKNNSSDDNQITSD